MFHEDRVAFCPDVACRRFSDKVKRGMVPTLEDDVVFVVVCAAAVDDDEQEC